LNGLLHKEKENERIDAIAHADNRFLNKSDWTND